MKIFTILGFFTLLFFTIAFIGDSFHYLFGYDNPTAIIVLFLLISCIIIFSSVLRKES